MKTILQLLTVIVAAGLAGGCTRPADTSGTAPSTEARLEAIEQQLDQIETLLRNLTEAAEDRVSVTVLGQVQAPGVYTVDPDAPIATAIAAAGGYTRLANPRRVSILCKDGTETRVDARTEPHGYTVKAGDIVTVGELVF